MFSGIDGRVVLCCSLALGVGVDAVVLDVGIVSAVDALVLDVGIGDVVSAADALVLDVGIDVDEDVLVGAAGAAGVDLA